QIQLHRQAGGAPAAGQGQGPGFGGLAPAHHIEIGGRGRGRGGAGGPGGGNLQGLLDRIPEEQRKQFMDRVDTNKNGQIDEDERQAVGEYMREQFGNMRNGGGNGGDGGQQRGGRNRGGSDA
ncbi:MAG: hypothetical protein ACO3IB_02535, partial [Phycisphaerales bacterium]